MTGLGVSYYNAMIKDREQRETARSNLAREQETNRTNRANELLKAEANYYSGIQAEASKTQAAAAKRNAMANWSQARTAQMGLGLTERNVSAAERNAETRVTEAGVAQQNADTAYTGVWTNLVSNVLGAIGIGGITAAVIKQRMAQTAGKAAAKEAAKTGAEKAAESLFKDGTLNSSAAASAVTLAMVKNYMDKVPSGYAVKLLAGFGDDSEVVPPDQVAAAQKWAGALNAAAKDYSYSDWKLFLSQCAAKEAEIRKKYGRRIRWDEMPLPPITTQLRMN